MTRRLIASHVPRHVEAAVLVVHGGGAREAGVQVSPTQLSVLRMIPIAHRITRAGHRRVAVFRLLNSSRGWNSEHTPVDDVRWALGQLHDRLPAGTPVGLVGHSLGGRAVLLAAGEDDVRSVVALAPWVYERDGAVDARGREVLIVHGTDDRIADPRRSAAAARQLRRTAQVAYIRVVGGKHAMLRRHGVFGRLAAEFTVTALLGRPPTHPADALERARGGSPVDV